MVILLELVWRKAMYILGMGSSKSVLLFIIWSVEGPGVHEHAVHLMWRCAWRAIVVWYLVGGTQR